MLLFWLLFKKGRTISEMKPLSLLTAEFIRTLNKPSNKTGSQSRLSCQTTIIVIFSRWCCAHRQARLAVERHEHRASATNWVWGGILHLQLVVCDFCGFHGASIHAFSSFLSMSSEIPSPPSWKTNKCKRRYEREIEMSTGFSPYSQFVIPLSPTTLTWMSTQKTFDTRQHHLVRYYAANGPLAFDLYTWV